MSYCYDMLHELKRIIGENSEQEYLNHINLLKMIKKDIEEERSKFQERTQGAELSLFIENVLTIKSNESKPPSDESDPASLVNNVIEKKMVIEKLQEKMSQRLGIINRLLENYGLFRPNPSVSKDTTPSVIKNSNINIFNVELNHRKASMNFYNNNATPQNFEWQKLFQKTKPVKAKRGTNGNRSNFRSKKAGSLVEEAKRNNSNARTITIEPLSQTTTSKFGVRNTPRKRRKSSVGFDNLAMQLLRPDSDEDGTPKNVRLYYEPKNDIGAAILAAKGNPDISPIRAEEESMFPNEIKEYQKPMKFPSGFRFTKGKLEPNSNHLRSLDDHPTKKLAGNLFNH